MTRDEMHFAEKDAPIEVILSMVHLAEMFGHTLPWAMLTEACVGLATPDELSWAVQDLEREGKIERTPKGLRFLLTEPQARPLPPGGGFSELAAPEDRQAIREPSLSNDDPCDLPPGGPQ